MTKFPSLSSINPSIIIAQSSAEILVVVQKQNKSIGMAATADNDVDDDAADGPQD